MMVSSVQKEDNEESQDSCRISQLSNSVSSREASYEKPAKVLEILSPIDIIPKTQRLYRKDDLEQLFRKKRLNIVP